MMEKFIANKLCELNWIENFYECKVGCFRNALPILLSALRRKIRLIEGNSKCCHLKKLTWKKDFAAHVFLYEAQNPIHCTLYMCIPVQYNYSRREGGGGRVEPERRGKEQQFTKLGRKYQHNWLYVQSINFDKHLPQSPFTGKFFRRRHCVSI